MAMATGWQTPSMQAPPPQSNPQTPQLVLVPSVSPPGQLVPTDAASPTGSPESGELGPGGPPSEPSSLEPLASTSGGADRAAGEPVGGR